MPSISPTLSKIDVHIVDKATILPPVVSVSNVEMNTKGSSDPPRFKWFNTDQTEFYQEALEKYGYDGAIDPEVEKKLVRKIDWLVLPCLGICYAFYYIDKTTLSYAAIFGIRTDLSLDGKEYSWLSAVFYFGWLAWAIPTNLMMQKSPVGKYLSINIMLWGILLMAQAASKNFIHMVVLRVLSGAFEATADPAFMLITSMFYTRAEQPMRISIWYAFNGLGVSLGGLLGYAIGHIKGALASWRYEFIVVGALCSTWAIAMFIILPDSPATSYWFTRDERLMCIARLRSNQTGVENKKFKWDQVREALSDPKTYLFWLLGTVANIPNGGISNFSTIIIRGLGFNTLETTLLGIPQGALVIIWILTGAFLNTKLPANSRTWVCMLFMLPTICGTLGFLLAPQNSSAGRLICYYLTGSYQTSFVLSLSLITSNVGGQTKKQIVSAFIFVGMCCGNIAGPFFYRAQDAPTYRLGIGSMLVCNVIEFFIFFVFRYLFARENRLRDEEKAKYIAEGMSEAVLHENETAFSDMTDKQNPNFRYVH